MLERSIVSRRALVAAAVALTAAPPRAPAVDGLFGDVYVGVRKSIVRSAQLADSIDRWQKKVYEDSRFGEAPPPDLSMLTLTPELARIFNDSAIGAYHAVVRGSSDAPLSRKFDASAANVFRGLTNSARQAVTADSERLGAGFGFVCQTMWRVFRDELVSPTQRERFETELGSRLLDALVPEGARSCLAGADGADGEGIGARARALALAREAVGVIERGGAVRGVAWQRASDFADGSADALSLLLQRSAWLDASLSMQVGTDDRFRPDFVGAVVRACLERCAATRSTHIEYYLDDVYRPDPEQYTPTQTLIEWTPAADD